MRRPVVDLSLIRIRPYLIGDADHAFAIFTAHAAATGKRGYLRFRSSLVEPNSAMLVAEEAGTIVGIGGLQYIEAGRIAILHTDGVLLGHQNRGIGTAMVMARLARIEDEIGLELVALLATEFSRGFYARFGFILAGESSLDPLLGFEIAGMELPFSTALRNSAATWL